MSCTVYFYLSDSRIPNNKEIEKAFKSWAKQGTSGKDNALESCDIKAMGGDPVDKFDGDFEGFYEHYKDLKRGTSSRSEPARRTSDPPERDLTNPDLDDPDDLDPPVTKTTTTRSTIALDDDEDWGEDLEDIEDEPPSPPPTDFDATNIFLKREVVADQNFDTFDFSDETLANLIDPTNPIIPSELITPSLCTTIEDLQNHYQKAATLNNGRVIVAVRPQTFYTRFPEDAHVVIPGVKPIANFGIPIATCTYLILTNTPGEFYRLEFNLTLLPDGQPKAYTASLEKFGTENGEEKSLYSINVDLMPIFENPKLLFDPPQKIKLRVHLRKEEDTAFPNPQVAQLMQAYTEAWIDTPVRVTLHDMSREDCEDLLQNPFIPQFIKNAIDTNALETLPPDSTTIPGGPLVDPRPIKEEPL